MDAQITVTDEGVATVEFNGGKVKLEATLNHNGELNWDTSEGERLLDMLSDTDKEAVLKETKDALVEAETKRKERREEARLAASKAEFAKVLDEINKIETHLREHDQGGTIKIIRPEFNPRAHGDQVVWFKVVSAAGEWTVLKETRYAGGTWSRKPIGFYYNISARVWEDGRSTVGRPQSIRTLVLTLIRLDAEAQERDKEKALREAERNDLAILVQARIHPLAQRMEEKHWSRSAKKTITDHFFRVEKEKNQVDFTAFLNDDKLCGHIQGEKQIGQAPAALKELGIPAGAEVTVRFPGRLDEGELAAAIKYMLG